MTGAQDTLDTICVYKALLNSINLKFIGINSSSLKLRWICAKATDREAAG